MLIDKFKMKYERSKEDIMIDKLSGVYVIFNKNEIPIYVGQSKDLEVRMCTSINERCDTKDSYFIKFILVPKQLRVDVENFLIRVFASSQLLNRTKYQSSITNNEYLNKIHITSFVPTRDILSVLNEYIGRSVVINPKSRRRLQYISELTGMSCRFILRCSAVEVRANWEKLK